ncbi:hypothetical protein [Dysosmobacter welbionis]|uniref:hypothetical protein n=1 Tax=Dysosmobacter welbionis TaxID=2093857 RepID=UPI00300F73A6
MELIAVIMKAPASTKRFEDATNLLNYGFSTYTLENVVPESALPAVPMSLGTQATVQPVLGENTHLLLEKARRATAAGRPGGLCGGAGGGRRSTGDPHHHLRGRGGVGGAVPSWRGILHGSPSARCSSGSCWTAFLRLTAGALHPLKSRRIATAFPCVPFRGMV